MAGKGVATDRTGCELAVIPVRVPYLPFVVVVGVTGGTAGNNKRRGGWCTGGMAAIEGLIVRKGIGRTFARTDCMDRIALEVENHVVLIFWACQDYSSILVV